MQVKVVPQQPCLDKDLINCMFDLKHMSSPYETHKINKKHGDKNDLVTKEMHAVKFLC